MQEWSILQRGLHSTCEFPVVGQFSPLHPLTLTLEERHAANILPTACHFAWSYPAADFGKLTGNNNAAQNFLAFGGFVYFDKELTILHTTTLVPSEKKCGGLQFDRPQPWSQHWTTPLMQDGRFQPITIKALSDLGAKRFCWLRPNESVLGDKVPHGGFAYLFHESECTSIDIYFPIISGDAYLSDDNMPVPMASFEATSSFTMGKGECKESIFCDSGSFPGKLGPFHTEYASFEQADFQFCKDALRCGQAMWLMEERSILQRLLHSTCEFPVVGQFSPLHPLTLTHAERLAAKIPLEAHTFAWAYPVADWGQLSGDNKVDRSFLSYGGFVYFDKDLTIIHTTTLVPSEKGGGGLQFDRPQHWNPDWTAPLKRHGRFQPITIKEMSDLGAKRFCWLRPNEPGLGDKVPHGGFAYLFDESNCTSEDRYFPIISGDAYITDDGANVPLAFFQAV